MAAECEKKLNTGRECGVSAIGRCTTCEEAFCLSHQGQYKVNSHMFNVYTDKCIPCAVERQAQEDKRRKEQYDPYKYFASGTARAALLASGVPSVELYLIGTRTETKRGILGTRYKDVEVVELFGHGWILGEVEWQYYVRLGSYEQTPVTEKWLTVLLDIPPDDPRIPYFYLNNASTLARVQPYSKGYELIDLRESGTIGGGQTSGGWLYAMQDVQRLIRNHTSI